MQSLNVALLQRALHIEAGGDSVPDMSHSRRPGERRDPETLLGVAVLFAAENKKSHWVPAFAGMTV